MTNFFSFLHFCIFAFCYAHLNNLWLNIMHWNSHSNFSVGNVSETWNLQQKYKIDYKTSGNDASKILLTPPRGWLSISRLVSWQNTLNDGQTMTCCFHNTQFVLLFGELELEGAALSFLYSRSCFQVSLTKFQSK